MKLIIAGSRDFEDYALLERKVDALTINTKPTVIISGGASGADALGELYAIKRGVEIKRFPADWDQYGKSAGPIRNTQMAEYGDALIAFWDGKSRGTHHMIKVSTKLGLKVRIVNY